MPKSSFQLSFRSVILNRWRERKYRKKHRNELFVHVFWYPWEPILIHFVPFPSAGILGSVVVVIRDGKCCCSDCWAGGALSHDESDEVYSSVVVVVAWVVWAVWRFCHCVFLLFCCCKDKSIFCAAYFCWDIFRFPRFWRQGNNKWWPCVWHECIYAKLRFARSEQSVKKIAYLTTSNLY